MSTMTTQNAFTSVSARRNFASPQRATAHAHSHSHSHSQPQPLRSPASQKTTVDWPPEVRSYVQRAFAAENASPNVDKSEMEIRLKQIIAQSVQDESLWSTDWNNALLPQQVILQERKITSMKSINPLWGHGVTPLSISDTNNQPLDTSSRKRKSSELDHQEPGQDREPPWRSRAKPNVFEDHLTPPEKRQRGDNKTNGLSKSQKRKQRFENARGTYTGSGTAYNTEKVTTPTKDEGPVIGRSATLEKKYFRLTSAPNPDSVRPLPVLEDALDFLKKKWKNERNYSYICDQLKSLRQDLTVQHIKTSFTVNVYELHARIALEKGDLGEYNQCQTQLRALYSQQLGGHPEEFKAYRILYFIHTCNRSDMNDVLADLTAAEKQHPAIRHALSTRSALALGNYHRFFQLYLESPNMGAYLLDMFVGRERLVALSNICVSFKPDVRLRFVTEELGFESDDESARFICDHGGQVFLEAKDDGEVRLLTGKALRFFETARAEAFKTVDIKGQI